MSFRDLRNFTEHLRALSYPKHVSLESFREPNFPLVADLLKWLTERFDPEYKLDGSLNSMEERILLIRSVAQFMATKANIKLNTKKLYGSDGYAVRELLKITSVLYESLNANSGDVVDNQDDTDLQYEISNKISDLKIARQLATEITANGASLYDLLSKEVEFKEIRDQSINRPLDMSSIESTLKRAIAISRSEVASIREQIENVAASEASLDTKIEKKKAELDRAEKRLQAMQKIKPAYQQEFKQLEREIEKLYEEYVLKYRCVEALKQQVSLMERNEAEAAEEQRKSALQLIQKYEMEDVIVHMGEADDFGSGDNNESVDISKDPRPITRPRTRLRVKTAANGDAHRPRVFGTMYGTGDGSDDDDDDIGLGIHDDDDRLFSDDDIDDGIIDNNRLPRRTDEEEAELKALGNLDGHSSASSDSSEPVVGARSINQTVRSNPNRPESRPGRRAPSARPSTNTAMLQDFASDEDF